MKRLDFLGDSLARLREFPDNAQSEAGFQPRRVQEGEDPADWKPMKTVGDTARPNSCVARVSKEDAADITTGHRARCQAVSRAEGVGQMDVQSFDNVWEALTDTPAEAANMTARSDLLLALQRAIGAWGLTQEMAAKRLGITRPRISDLLAGKINKFSLDALVNLAAQAGLAVEIHIHQAA